MRVNLQSYEKTIITSPYSPSIIHKRTVVVVIVVEMHLNLSVRAVNLRGILRRED